MKPLLFCDITTSKNGNDPLTSFSLVNFILACFVFKNHLDAFLAHYEQISLNDCPDEFKRVYYKRYVDDIFLLFRSAHHLEKFNEYVITYMNMNILNNEYLFRYS